MLSDCSKELLMCCLTVLRSCGYVLSDCSKELWMCVV